MGVLSKRDRYYFFLSQTLGAAAIEPTLAAGLNSIVHTYYTILPMWQCGMAHVYVGATGLFMPSAHSTCGGWPEGGKKKQPLQPKPFERERESLADEAGLKICMGKSELTSLNRASPILSSHLLYH